MKDSLLITKPNTQRIVRPPRPQVKAPAFCARCGELGVQQLQRTVCMSLAKLTVDWRGRYGHGRSMRAGMVMEATWFSILSANEDLCRFQSFCALPSTTPLRIPISHRGFDDTLHFIFFKLPQVKHGHAPRPAPYGCPLWCLRVEMLHPK